MVTGVRVRRTRALAAEDAFWRHKGIPVTSPARTLLDLAATMPDKPPRRAMSRAQSLRLTSLPQLAAILDRTGPRPGRVRFARVLATGPRPTRSELEERVLDLIRAGGFATPDVNVPLSLSGRQVIPDFRWPQQRLVVEPDGSQWYDNPQARAQDAERAESVG
jgi:hypothetical protein